MEKDEQEEGETVVTTTDNTHRKKWIPLELIVSLYFLSFVITSPVMHYYIYGRIAEEYGIKNFQKDESSGCSVNTSRSKNDTISLIQGEAADQMMYLTFASTFPAVIPTLFLGSVSDKYGRKPTMVVTFTGLLVRQLIYVVVIATQLPFQIFYVGNIIEGITGYYGSALMAALGMLADITKPGKERALRITILEGVVATLVGLAIFAIGFWIEYDGFLWPMVTATSLSFVGLLIIILLVPETNKHRNYKGSIFNLKYNLRWFRIFYEDTPGGRRRKMILCALLMACSVSITSGKSAVHNLFLLNEPLCWSVVHTQVFTAVGVACNWGAGMFLLGFIQKCVRDTGLISIGIMFGIVSFTVNAFASQDWLVYIAAAVATLAVIITPMLRSVMFGLASAEEQGVLFASQAFIELLSASVTAVLYTRVYKETESYFPGCVFLVMAGFLVIALILCIPLIKWTKKNSEMTVNLIQEEKE